MTGRGGRRCARRTAGRAWVSLTWSSWQPSCAAWPIDARRSPARRWMDGSHTDAEFGWTYRRRPFQIAVAGRRSRASCGRADATHWSPARPLSTDETTKPDRRTEPIVERKAHYATIHRQVGRDWHAGCGAAGVERGGARRWRDEQVREPGGRRRGLPRASWQNVQYDPGCGQH
jgi:hypothetical protein